MNVSVRLRDATIEATVPVISVRSVRVPAPGRGDDLVLRVSAPAAGAALPIVLFSHGFGSSMDGYAPLADFWAVQGFAVIQPTHLDSRRLALPTDDPRQPMIWRHRVDDLRRILDNLPAIERSLPGLGGRLDTDRIAAAGHSFGGHTVSLLLGARMLLTDGEDLSDPRISAGVMLAAGGRGGKDLSPFAIEHLPYLDTSYDRLTVPTLVVAGDQDQSPLTVRGPDWFYDPYFLSPGAKALVTLFGGEHMLGGISGYGVTETSDESPDRVLLVQRMTSAFRRSALDQEDPAWGEACEALAGDPAPAGRVERK